MVSPELSYNILHYIFGGYDDVDVDVLSWLIWLLYPVVVSCGIPDYPTCFLNQLLFFPGHFPPSRRHYTSLLPLGVHCPLL